MKSFENNFLNSKERDKNFENAVKRAIDEMKKSDYVRESIKNGQTLGFNFYNDVIEIVEHETGDKIRENIDFEENISDKIIKIIKSQLGNDGFSLESDDEEKHVSGLDIPDSNKQNVEKYKGAGGFIEKSQNG